jgi:anti-sigma regulatory factor (Ser/Thr protein kinase)
MSSIYVDPQRIFQVIANLISNAIRFTFDGGKVILRSHQTADDIIVTVQDNGVGISAEDQEDVFSKFRQINRGAGAGSQGTGLGLAICKGIVEFHGGEIWIESEADKGSSFSFSISKIDSSFILRKHLESLGNRYGESGRKIGLLVTRFEIKDGETEKNAIIITSLIEELIAASKDFMGTKEDVVIKTDEFELSFAFLDAEKQQIRAMREKIREIIKNRVRKNYTGTPIVPMSGVAVYPDDSCEIRDMEKIARNNIELNI